MAGSLPQKTIRRLGLVESALADPVLKQGLIGSAALHAALFVVLAVRAVFYPSEPLQLERAIRVDMVGLPSKAKPTLEEPAPPAPAPPKPAEPTAAQTPPTPALPKPTHQPPPEPNKVNLNKAKKSQSDALKRLEALNKIENMRKAPQPNAAAPPAATAPIRGNQKSAGNSLTGIAKLDYDGYLDGLDAHVKKHWALPEWLADANLKAQVVVWLDARGNVVKKTMTRSSNNPVFDQKAMEAIDRASPFPPPPARLANIFAVDGVKLGFPE